MAGLARTTRLLRVRLALARVAKLSTQMRDADSACSEAQRSHCTAAGSPDQQAAPSERRATEERYRHQDGFDFVAASVKKCLTHLGPWTVGDLAFGIMALADAHKNQAYLFKGKPVTDTDQLQRWQEEVTIADAIYEPTVDKVAALCSLEAGDVVTFVADGDRMRPAYCIALRPARRQVVLAVRGTKSLGDAVTILTGSGADFQGGHTHAGMLHSAQWLLHNETRTLGRLLGKHPGYSLRFIGHSLGAGAAALYAMLLHGGAQPGDGGRLPEGVLPTCLAVATPACTTEDLAAACDAYVTSLICQNDVVPRMCVRGLEQLRQEVKQTAWQGDMGDKLAGEMAGAAERYRAVAGVFQAGDARAVGALGLLGDAWDALAQHAARHSDRARELLGRMVLSISRLPVRVAVSEKLAAGVDMLPQELGRKLQALYARSESSGRSDAEALPAHADSESHPDTPIEALGPAADGDIDAELAELLRQADEAEAAEKAPREVVPAPRLIPPGAVVFLRRTGDGAEAYEALAGPPGQLFDRILLSRSMVTDHLCSTYMAALGSALRRLGRPAGGAGSERAREGGGGVRTKQ